ncbi:RNA-binding S4 domain-containing protein [Magnetofaba australis]|uniref:Putative RNA-binding S4 domain-containing protein n=1 Tax=Magnetofaba australis IT-1 TaxID=1434232 RepID=A0A1Y2JZR8_9PROT|nr:RNA-binding S4 domain-containing protein [Magnetofaba australis]OSM00415.1 putative RNA-binding S4 domain-containing protein [Magnetofaba australis IT-1]
MARGRQGRRQADANETISSDDSVRLDRWLWAARFFKTRPLATEAVTGGHVHVNGQRVKPAKSLRVGDELEIQKGLLTFVVTVQDLSQQRGPASVAQQLYSETPESAAKREQEAEMRRMERLSRPTLQPGRPNKRDRRLLSRVQQR